MRFLPPTRETFWKPNGFTVDYVEDHWDRRLAAVFLEGVRLIDNVPLPNTKDQHASLS